MKRGLFGLIVVVLFLSLPAVLAADTFLGLVTGTSDSSLIFLKTAYAMLIFIIFVKVCRETIFKKEQQKLGNIFSLLLAFFAFRFTPNPMVEAFGWVIMFVAPFIIFWTLYGVFVKKKEGTFSWARFLLALFSTLLLWFALGSTPAFAAGLGSTPGFGGFFDELFSEAHYFFFSELSPLIVFFIAGILLFALFMLLQRLSGGGNANQSFGDAWLRGLLWFLLIGGILSLLGYILGGGLVGLALPAGALGAILQGGFWLAVLAGIVFFLWLLYKFPLFRQVLRRGLGFLFWRVPRALFWVVPRWIWTTLLWPLLQWIFGLIAALGSALANRWRAWRGRPRAPLGNRRLILDLQAGTQPIGDIAQLGGPRITVQPGNITPFQFTLYRTRRTLGRNWGRVPLQGATVNITRITNGNFTPPNGTSDAQGRFPSQYAAPAIAGNARMQIQVTHPDIDPRQVIPEREIQIGVMQTLAVVFQTNPTPASIPRGGNVEITVELRDGRGNGVNGADISIAFPRVPRGDPLATPLTGTSTAGAAGTPGLFAVRTPNITLTAPTVEFVINITNAAALGFTTPAPVRGVITLNTPATPDLEIRNVEARVGRTLLNGTPTLPLRVGQNASITLVVQSAVAGGAARAIDTATVSLLLPTGVAIPFRALGARGSYVATLNSTGFALGPQRFIVTATLAGYNAASFDLDLEIEDAPQLTVGIIPPPSPMRIGITGNIQIEVNQAVPPGVVSPVDAEIEILLNRNPFVRQRTGRPGVGELVVPFLPPREGIYTFTVRVREAGYQDPPEQSFSVTVLPLAAMDVNAILVDLISGNPVTGMIAIGQRIGISLSATERATAAAITTGTATLSPATQAGTTLVRASGPLTAGAHVAEFTAAAPGRYTYTVLVNAPGYVAPSPPTQIIISVGLPPLQVSISPVRSPLRVGDTTNIDLTITDASGRVVRGATVTCRSARGLPAGFISPRLVTGGAGNVFSGSFAPNARTPAQTYSFDLEVNATGYAPWTGAVQIEVLHTPGFRVTVNWVPEPSTSNRYMLMNFIVIDDASGNPVRGATIALSDAHANPITVDRAGPYTTNTAGQLPTDLRISLGGRNLDPGKSEVHTLTITVSYVGYTDSSGSVDITFHPPRSRLGGPRSVAF